MKKEWMVRSTILVALLSFGCSTEVPAQPKDLGSSQLGQTVRAVTCGAKCPGDDNGCGINGWDAGECGWITDIFGGREYGCCQPDGPICGFFAGDPGSTGIGECCTASSDCETNYCNGNKCGHL
jgi:hypothetical protein